MTAALSLAHAELTMLARNRTAAVTAVLVPLAAGLWMIDTTPSDSPLVGAVGDIAAIQLLGIIGFTLAITATTTIVARREQHLLERWRTSGTSDWSLLVGTLAPAGVLLAVQVAVLFTATTIATATVPAQPLLLTIGIVLAGLLGGAVAFVTAAFTRTVEAANVTILPALLTLMGGGVWAASTTAGQITWPMRATGGGAITELVRVGWHGPVHGAGILAGLQAAGPSLAILTTLTMVLGMIARHAFRWGTRA